MSETGAPVSYWKPSPALTGLVTGYHRYQAALPPGLILRDAFFPSWATIRIALHDSSPWTLTLGTRHFDPVPPVALVGPSSYAGYMRSTGGTLAGVGVLPLGWAQLFGGDVSRYANRAVPLTQVDPGANRLRDMLEAGEEPAAVFDAWLEERLHRRPPADPRIATLFAMLDDPTVTKIEAIAETLAMSPRALAALTRFNFGFTPKLLLRRCRFMRALSAVLTRPDDAGPLLEDAGYWDRSHFLRDSHLFLGCSIREFNKRRGPLNAVAMRVRETVLGAPV